MTKQSRNAGLKARDNEVAAVAKQRLPRNDGLLNATASQRRMDKWRGLRPRNDSKLIKDRNMEKFQTFTGLVAPIDRSNVDTDAIIPKQYLKSIHRTGFGPNLFDDWRYLDPGEPGDDHSKRRLNPDFVLNQPRYQGAEILLARKNFGCGSSREHAVWALTDYGFRAAVAPSFADIFYSNSFKNGFLPVQLPEAVISELFRKTFEAEGFTLTIDLPNQQVITPAGEAHGFDIDAGLKDRLLRGLDDIGVTLTEAADAIRAYENRRAQEAPWLFPDRQK